MNKFILADNICRLCKERDISVEAFAEAIGKSPRQVNRYRNGNFKNIPFEVLNQMAAALQVDVNDLFSEMTL